MSVPSIKVNQEAAIKQLLGQLGQNGNQNNVISIVQVSGVDYSDFNLEKFIDSLPEPRMENLIARAKEVALKRYSGDGHTSLRNGYTAASRWLGINVRTMFNHRRDKDVIEVLPGESPRVIEFKGNK